MSAVLLYGMLGIGSVVVGLLLGAWLARSGGRG